MKSLITIAVSLAFAAVASGNLPKILFEVRKAQIALIKESQASKWPKAMTLPSRQKTSYKENQERIFPVEQKELLGCAFIAEVRKA